MKRREFLKTMTAGAAAMTLPGCLGTVGSQNAKHPNILFIFDDQHRKEAVSCYGGTNVQTPNIDRLAKEGIKFTNAISTSPLCTPYRGMLMTGKYPTHTGLLVNFVNPHRKERGIADCFNEAGYHTGFIGKWHLTASSVGNQTMISGEPIEGSKLPSEPEHVRPGRGRLGFQYWAAFNFHMEFRKGYYYRDEPIKEFYPDYETEWVSDETIRFLKKHKDSDRPFFLMIAPHYAHPNWRGEKDVSRSNLERIRKDITIRPNASQQFPLKVTNTAGKTEGLTLEQVRTYYAMCENVDDNVGSILDYLEQSGLAENTIVVFTSDHGEQLGSQGRRSKLVPFEESINVPLIMRWPKRIKPGTTSDALYGPMDHLATLCKLAGAKAADDIDGIDLSGEVLQTGKIDRQVVLIAQYVASPNYCRSHRDELQWRGVRGKNHTYVKYVCGKELLFDNITDPYQMNNLIADEKSNTLLETMRLYLKKLLAEAHDDVLPATSYAEWFDDTRTVIHTGKGAI